ncbi:RNA 2',3'-cyclic phosphodiesterase [Desulfallas thermosapovorans]|uniref:RNA 2',3'-cyclic phosphodiesterase n=1 Tax=Desulfallas thermosapovorans DSM 6562 TaxID=1121431 RepID=A0A5S4ZWT7_9FIRM|nr:RNA 2',3'-cyclic phosphodiesterase [Desulfallas thermosapovorans]TYO97279.1 2'-5' RNA ligase [Desulfallas thermosapovorans DSM 6562]
MRQLRLFWAVNLPEDIKAGLAALQSDLRTAPVNVKWVEKHNLHLTVKFLGDVEDARIDEIVRVVDEAVHGTGGFELQLSGLGFFPGPRRPRVIWVGVHGEVQKFHRLYRRVEECMTALGWADGQNFAPHLTLGRLRSPQGSDLLVRRAREIGDDRGNIGGLAVSSIDLMKSRLTSRGPVYQLLASVRLTP